MPSEVDGTGPVARGPRLSILLLGNDDRSHAGCVLDHLDALRLHSRHDVRAFNPVGLKSARFLDLDEFAVVAIHYSLLITADDNLSPIFREKLRRYTGLKVLFAMDEYRDVDRITAMMRYIGVRVLFTCVPAHAIGAVYGDRLPGVEIVPVLTGYIPDRLLGRDVIPTGEREIDIGYRGRSLPYWLGEFAQEKRRIGEGVLERAPRLGLVCDIAWTEADRLYGTAWDDRVATWRAALAVEAGSGIVDHDGSIRARTEAYLEAHPGAEFETVRREVLGRDDGNVDFKVISSRVLEAIALRTALVMFPGRYSDVVRPDVHYLVLERDFSNLDRVAAALRETRSLEAMTERAYRDVVATGRYSYRAFAETIDAVLERHAAMSWVPTRPSPRQVLARAERFARRAAAISGDRAIRSIVAASAVTRDPDLRRLIWRYISAGRARPAVAPRRLLADILKLHLLRRAQVGGSEVSIPFEVNAEFQPGGEVMFRTRPTGRPTGEAPPDISDLDLSSIEAAIRDGHLRKLSWDHSTLSGRLGLRIGNRRTLHLGGAGGFNSLDALAGVANRFPSETAAALGPLFTIRRGAGEQAEPVSPMWANLSAWAVENAACLDRLGFVRAFEQSDRKRPKTRRSPEPTPADPRAIRREQATLRLAEMHALELDIPSRRDAPHAVIKHDRINRTHAGASYEIEVITWDAYPGMPVPALVYRPLDDQPVARPCVIVALASQTSVATHGELYSAQRHAANLALRGFVVFVFASGLCFNGLNGERLANSYAFDTYGRLSGSGFTSRSIDIQMYLRAFDYMAGRADVDSDRIAASGYSYGGRMAYYLAVFEPRVAALGIAAAAVITEGDDSDTVYSARRDAAMTSRVPDWFTNGEPERIHRSAGPFTDALGDTLLLAPRPFRLVLGNQDPGTSISMASTRIERLVDVYRALDSRAMPPDLALDDGSHHFDASRRRVIEDWLAAVLRAEPLLAQPHEAEHETPVLNRSLLERRPSAPEPLTTRAIFARRALGEIEAKRASRLIESSTPEQTRRRIARLLKLSSRVVSGLARPMLLAERAYGLGPQAFNARFWLLPLGDNIDAAALTLTPQHGLGGSAALYVLDGDRLLPERHLLRAQIDDRAAVMVVYLPGFGPLRSPQERLGDLAMRMSMRLDRTLLGLGVEAVRSGLDLLDSWCPGVTVTAESHGIDAGAVIAFATVLDDRIAKARMHESVATFTRFLTSQVDAIPAPTLSIPGLAAQVDIPDLQGLAGNGRLTIESESDLHEHVIDLRPVAQ